MPQRSAVSVHTVPGPTYNVAPENWPALGMREWVETLDHAVFVDAVRGSRWMMDRRVGVKGRRAYWASTSPFATVRFDDTEARWEGSKTTPWKPSYKPLLLPHFHVASTSHESTVLDLATTLGTQESIVCRYEKEE